MIAFVRQLTALGAASAVTWWLLFSAPVAAPVAPEPPVQAAQRPLSLRPVVEEVVAVPSAPVQETAAVEQQAPPDETALAETEEPVDEAGDPEGDRAGDELAPPPPEAGSRSGDEDGESAAAPTAEDPPEPEAPEAAAPVVRPASALARDAELLAVAESELSGEAAIGFATVFLSSAEEQLAIASAFGEDVVLVPRGALDATDAQAESFRLDLSRGPARARVTTLPGRPALERYRQYRDLFAYDFARLPAPLRELRKAVVRRDHVYLFAALIPPSEWAVVVGRRREALATLRLEEADVERFVMRYVRIAEAREPGPPQYDIRVDEIVLADGTRHRPQP